MPSFSTKVLSALVLSSAPIFSIAQDTIIPPQQCESNQFYDTISVEQPNTCAVQSFFGDVWLVWEVNDNDCDEYQVEVSNGSSGSSLYRSAEFYAASSGNTKLPALAKNGDLQVSYFCTNERDNCAAVTFKWKLVDCGCPDSSTMLEDCKVNNFDTAESAACSRYCPAGSQVSSSLGCEGCPAGSFSNEQQSTDCEECPPGTFQEATGKTSCAICPSGKYSDSSGATECTECPDYELARAGIRQGMSSSEECSANFKTSGFWRLEGSGSISGSSSYTYSFAQGVGQEDTVETGTSLERAVGSAMSEGTSFESINSVSVGWTAGVDIKGFSASRSFNLESGLSSGETSSYEISESVTSSLTQVVSKSTTSYSEVECTQSCGYTELQPSATAFAWRWIHLIYDETREEVLMEINTCQTACLYHPDDQPLCPPGRCDNVDCTRCTPGTFEDETIDGMASTFTTDSGPTPTAPTPAAPTTDAAPTPAGPAPSLRATSAGQHASTMSAFILVALLAVPQFF